MTKKEVIDHIFSRSGVEKHIVKSVVDCFIYEIKKAIISGESVYLRGFMTFKVKKRAQKRARIITKNESIFIPSHYSIVGVFSKHIKEQLKNIPVQQEK